MKRLIPLSIVLCGVMMVTSCASSAGEDNTPELVTGGQTMVSSTETTVVSSDKGQTDDKFYITYNGVKIVLGEEVAPVVKAIGKEYIYTENPSCAYVGIDYTYDYDSIIIYAQTKDGKEFINTVEIRDDKVDCYGIKVGQTLNDAKAVLGTPVSEAEFGIIYDKNETELQFITEGSDKIVSILYTNTPTE